MVIPAVNEPLMVESTVNVVPVMCPVPDQTGFPDCLGMPKFPSCVFGGVVQGELFVGATTPPVRSILDEKYEFHCAAVGTCPVVKFGLDCANAAATRSSRMSKLTNRRIRVSYGTD